MNLCLNMIVKNEAALIERCLASVADYITCWVIGDTGSTDATPDLITRFFVQRGIPGELHRFPFINFEQARNEALDRARASACSYEYLLLTDADMEMKVRNGDFRTRLQSPSYRVLQSSSDVSYWNTRLLHRAVKARYRGVTHEYIDVGGPNDPLNDIWFLDHATGSNRAEKFDRDITLLTEALRSEPDNARYWFYLAQSYRDAGRIANAASAYAKRASMGGWDEETWYARWQWARCLLGLGDEAGFLREAIAAFNARPHRAEPLYDLAKYYRERGMNEIGMLYCTTGVRIPRPEQDVLMVDDFIYKFGLPEEYSIMAYYTRDARKEYGRVTCDWLATNTSVPQAQRALARRNAYFYARPASALLRSLRSQEVAFAPPPVYRPSNPSIARWGEALWLNQRAVNYSFVDNRYVTANEEPITTRNFLLRLDECLNPIGKPAEVLAPQDFPPRNGPGVVGLEDIRLFALRDDLWGCATVQQLNPDGRCEMLLFRLAPEGAQYRITDWRVLCPEREVRHEKNWMPQVIGNTLRFVYAVDPLRLIDEEARTIRIGSPKLSLDHWRGGSQLVRFSEGWLCLIHEVTTIDDRRHYAHRFVWFDSNTDLRTASPLFRFSEMERIEFAAGLAWHPDGKRLIVSYGLAERESWLCVFEADDLKRVLGPISS